MKQPAEVLREAAQILMRDGWIQGQEQNERGEKCAVGAIVAASFDDAGIRATHLFVSWLAKQGYGAASARGILIAMGWNDAPERTAEDVILALKQCAYELENEA